MISTGNDVVALAAINIARTKQQNFYKKIISDSEKGLYDRQFSDSIRFEHFVWMLWSVKESIYKFLQRISPQLVFSPTKIVIDELILSVAEWAGPHEGQGFDKQSVYSGTAVFNDQVLYFRSIISNEFIFSVAADQDDFNNICWGIKPIHSSAPNDQSEAVRELLIKRLSAIYPGGDLQTNKSHHGYPIVLKDGIELPLPVSLAHHENYVGYSFRIPG